MATSGTNYTAKWNLQNGVLTIQPVSGNSGIMRYRASDSVYVKLDYYITLTDDEWASVTKIKFVSSVRFQVNKGFMQTEYVAKSLFWDFFKKASNVTQIDVTGLNITGATGVASLFGFFENLTEITGLANLDVSNCTNFANMFLGAKITSLDISTFSVSALNNADSDVYCMFENMDYCNSIKLPANFQRTFSDITHGALYYGFGIASSRIPATKDGVTISSDEDFFKLTATSQGGTWTRDISGSAKLKFNVNKVVRDGNSAEMQYTYYTSSATVEVYLKETSQSSFPSTPSDTFSIEGTGTGSRTLTLASDSAYDVMVKVYDGETTLYTYPSIDSNVLLFSVDEDGNTTAAGDIEDGQGNVLADKANTSSLAKVATSGSYNDLSNKPNDHIVDAGNKNGWSYRKWKSGKVEAWYNYDGSSGTFTTWVSPIRYKDVTVSIPSGIFTASPKIFPVSRNNQFWVVHASPSSATSFNVRLATVASSSLTPSFRIYATSY